jgi:hypothetical protein
MNGWWENQEKTVTRRLDGDLKIILIFILAKEVVSMEHGFGSCPMTERISVLVQFKTRENCEQVG